MSFSNAKEVEIKKIWKQIDDLFKMDKSIPIVIFNRMDKEYTKLVESKSNVKNPYINFNYNYRKSIQFYQEKEFSKTLEYFLAAICFLMKQAKTPNDRQWILYLTYISKLNIKKINIEEIQDLFFRFLDYSLNNFASPPIRFSEIIRSTIITFFFRPSNITVNNFEIYNNFQMTLADNTIVEMKRAKYDKYVISELYTLVYWINKKLLYYFINACFQASDPIKVDVDIDLTKIKQTLQFSSSESLELANQDNQYSYFLKKVDKFTANYIEELYINNNVIKAFNKLIKIRDFLILTFYHNSHIPINALQYFREEWSFLSLFLKSKLFEKDTQKLKNYLKQDWQIEITDELADVFKKLDLKFKYDFKDSNFYLRAIPSTLDGDFSEFFIHLLLLNLHQISFGMNFSNEDIFFSSLFNSIYKCSSYEKILLNDNSVSPDIDINVNNEIAILLKNSTSFAEHKIMDELKAVKSKDIVEVYYGFNFIKCELKGINQLIEMKNRLEKSLKLKLTFVDISDLVKNIMLEIERKSGKKIKVVKNDLVKLFGY